MIKNIYAILICALIAGNLSAQTYELKRCGQITDSAGSVSFANPSTTVVVDVTVRRETIRVGPYARFAQKHFGVVAPLADKEIYEIVSAKISWEYDVQAVSGSSAEITAPSVSVLKYSNMPLDKVSSVVKNADVAAQEAAKTIFNIRARRLELIMGDVGENVYGEGLRAAIERMDKIESDYLELFFGKHETTTYTQRFFVVPEKGTETYVVSRFSPTLGFSPAADLNNEPLLLKVELKGNAGYEQPVIQEQVAEPAAAKKGKSQQPVPKIETVEYMVPELTVCRLFDGRRELIAAPMPIYQLGAKVTLRVE